MSNVSILKNAFLGHEKSDLEREKMRRYRKYSYKTKKKERCVKSHGFLVFIPERRVGKTVTIK